MEEPTTKPRGSKPASPRSTYSETDRSEVNTPEGLAPAVCASRVSAAFGSHTAEPWSCCWLPNSGIAASRFWLVNAVPRRAGAEPSRTGRAVRRSGPRCRRGRRPGHRRVWLDDGMTVQLAFAPALSRPDLLAPAVAAVLRD